MIIGISGKMQSGKNTVASIIQYLIYKDKVKDSSLSLNAFLNNIFIEDSYSGFIQKSFAAKLKQIVSILTGIPVWDLEKEEVKSNVLGEEWWYYKGRNGSLIPYTEDSKRNNEDLIKLTPRKLLQLLGTDCGRNILHPNIWINSLMNEYKSYDIIISNSTKKFGEAYEIIGHGEHDGKIINTPKFKYQLEAPKYPNWIITDMRFPNELQAIKDRGGITIRVNRFMCSKCGNTDNFERDNDLCNECGHFKSDDKEHESETALDNAEFNYVIDNNGTIDELVEKVKEILIKENIIC